MRCIGTDPTIGSSSRPQHRGDPPAHARAGMTPAVVRLPLVRGEPEPDRLAAVRAGRDRGAVDVAGVGELRIDLEVGAGPPPVLEVVAALRALDGDRLAPGHGASGGSYAVQVRPARR